MTNEISDYPYEDIEYLRHESGPLLARIFRPQCQGPLPAVIELHGGAWTHFDRTRGKSVHEALARAGVFVMAIDFRQGKEGAYPKSLQDINYAIRWLKLNAAQFDVASDRIGLSGNSTGGHLAMLSAMRPHDPRYASRVEVSGLDAFDATVRCVVMLWPVINPLSRYRYAKRQLRSVAPAPWAESIITAHDGYWRDEQAMAEANPMLALERGERVSTPPAMWLQATQDQVHDYRDEDSDFEGTESARFADRYRRAGGRIEVEYFDAPMMFTTVHPTLPASVEALKRIAAFVHRHAASANAPQARATSAPAS